MFPLCLLEIVGHSYWFVSWLSLVFVATYRERTYFTTGLIAAKARGSLFAAQVAKVRVRMEINARWKSKAPLATLAVLRSMPFLPPLIW